jgi:hypothetical protein
MMVINSRILSKALSVGLFYLRITGLTPLQGFQFSTPLSDVLQDRHVRFVTDAGGIWGEPVRVVSGLRRDATAAVLTPQFNGTATPAVSTWPTSVGSLIDQLPVWADFTLDQLSPTNFTIAKRTTGGRAASFLSNAGFGTHASGLGYVGGAAAGGVVFALKGGVTACFSYTPLLKIALLQISGRVPPEDLTFAMLVLVSQL